MEKGYLGGKLKVTDLLLQYFFFVCFRDSWGVQIGKTLFITDPLLDNLTLCSVQPQMSQGNLCSLQDQVLLNFPWTHPPARASLGRDVKADFNCYSSTAAEEISVGHSIALVLLHRTEGWVCVLQLEIRPVWGQETQRFWVPNRGMCRTLLQNLSWCSNVRLVVVFVIHFVL